MKNIVNYVADNILQIILTIVFLSFVLLSLLLGYRESATAATVMTGGAGICLAFIFLSRFKKFKGFGMEMELWDEQKKEAEELTLKLKNLSALLVHATFRTISYSNRMTDFPLKEKEIIRKGLERLINEIGLSMDEYRDDRSVYLLFPLFDMAIALRNIICLAAEGISIAARTSRPGTADKIFSTMESLKASLPNLDWSGFSSVTNAKRYFSEFLDAVESADFSEIPHHRAGFIKAATEAYDIAIDVLSNTDLSEDAVDYIYSYCKDDGPRKRVEKFAPSVTTL